MDIQFEPDLQAKLEELARESGRETAAIVQDAVAGYVDGVAETRQMLDSRYDEIESGRVTLIPGDEVFARLRAKSLARRVSSGS